MSALLMRWLNAILPACCILCGLPSGAARICPGCSADLPRIVGACARCARPGLASPGKLCGACLSRPPPWDLAVAGLVYEYPVDQLVRKFKFRGDLGCGQLLADELCAAVAASAADRPELLIPVPLHFSRRLRRGFNQAEFLARELGRSNGIPVRLDLLRRRKPTPAQSGLDRRQRRRNLRGAFRCRALPATHLGLVDDVLTTGSTLRECALMLKSAGALRLSVWVAARVPTPGTR